MTSNQMQELESKLKQRFATTLQWDADAVTVALNPANFSSHIRFLRFEANFILLLDICAVDRLKLAQNASSRFELVYILLNMEEHLRLQAKVQVNGQEKIPSVAAFWENAKWCETEVSELMGIPIENATGKSLFLSSGFTGHPLKKDYTPDSQGTPRATVAKRAFPGPPPSHPRAEWVALGPNHPAMADSMRIFLLLEGEKVCRAKCEIGLLHRGVEKLTEQRTYQQIIPYAERLNYNSPAINAVGWCMSVERAAQLKIPDRAKAIRMILQEFSRINDHLSCLGTSLLDAGAIKNYHDCLDLREYVAKAMQSYSGSRHLNGVMRIGGLAHDLPTGWVTEALEVAKRLSQGIKKLNLALIQGRSWIEKTKSGTVSASDAINWGLTGPTLRACGVNYDLRKTNPYDFYQDVDFEIPLGINGDAYDRFLVRLEEMRQSLRIITQVLDNLPSGEVFAENSPWNLRGEEAPPLPAREQYHFIEAANGELGFYLVSDGTPSPYRLKIRPPGMALGQAYPQMAKNTWYEKALLAFTSLNLVPGEIDR